MVFHRWSWRVRPNGCMTNPSPLEPRSAIVEARPLPTRARRGLLEGEAGMTSGGWMLWWAGSLMMFSLALLFASPLADSGLFGFLGLAVPATWIGMGRRRAEAARDELLTRERAARTEAE